MSGESTRGFFGAEIRRIARYLGIGVLNTAIFGALSGGGAAVGLHYALYTAVGYAAGITFSYFMNRRFTFRDDPARWRRTLPRFLVANLALWGAAELIQYVAIDILEVREIIGVLAGMAFYTGLGYILNRSWVFGLNTRSR